MGTTVGVVGPVGGVGHLVGLHGRPAQTQLTGQRLGVGPLSGGQRGRHGGDHVDPFRTQYGVGRVGQQGGVGATGKGHNHPVDVKENLLQRIGNRFLRDPLLRDAGHDQVQPTRARTTSSSSTIPV